MCSNEQACELRLTRSAEIDAPGPVRRALASFLEAHGVASERRLEVATAVGEALANAVEHAYPQGAPGVLSIVARIEAPDQLVVVIADAGTFVSRPSRAGRGFGMRIMQGLARSVEIDTERGTTVRMLFDLGAPCAPLIS